MQRKEGPGLGQGGMGMWQAPTLVVGEELGALGVTFSLGGGCLCVCVCGFQSDPTYIYI